ncbi:MAG: hypothetical protein JNM66_28365 [Bryobacterales bacterium]|nr:hypothetical protein [Bryobacterales bacterium]
MGPMHFVEWRAEELLPAAWANQGAARVFNPGLLADGDGYLLAYRVVLPDGARRIGLCRLDTRFHVIAGTGVAWSDHHPQGEWFADPRLYRLDGRIYLHWNSGWGDEPNRQYLQEFNERNLLPTGTPRELMLDGPRQPIEKNWMFFGGPAGRGIYFPRPLRFLRCDWPATVYRLESAGISQLPDGQTWDDGGYEAQYGPLRGGAPPVPDGDGYWCVAHSLTYAPEGYRYMAAVFRFRDDGVVTHRPRAPLPLPNPYRCRRQFHRLNPYAGEVIYPCGMARAEDGWAVSYGINDERCAVAIMTDQELISAVEGVAR